MRFGLVGPEPPNRREYFAKALRVAPPNAEILRGTAVVEEALGHWEAAVEHFRQAEQLDPRSATNPFALRLLRPTAA